MLVYFTFEITLKMLTELLYLPINSAWFSASIFGLAPPFFPINFPVVGYQNPLIMRLPGSTIFLMGISLRDMLHTVAKDLLQYVITAVFEDSWCVGVVDNEQFYVSLC